MNHFRIQPFIRKLRMTGERIESGQAKELSQIESGQAFSEKIEF
jgi:hypothetical protein